MKLIDELSAVQSRRTPQGHFVSGDMETVHAAIPRILAALRAADDMREELYSMACQHGCGCGHPACNRCGDAAEARKALATWKEATE